MDSSKALLSGSSLVPRFLNVFMRAEFCDNVSELRSSLLFAIPDLWIRTTSAREEFGHGMLNGRKIEYIL